MTLQTQTLLAVIVMAAAARADEPLAVERALVRAAPGLLDHCRQKGYRNVGVLKFLAAKDGDAKFRDNVGTLNTVLARQLETALILANSPREGQTVGIIDNASGVAACTPGANHLTGEGRLKLFGARYPLAWGTDTVEADAFFTGTVGVANDLKTLTIALLALDRATNSLYGVGSEVSCRCGPARLSEFGQSFTTRGAFDGGRVEIKPPEESQRDEFVFEAAARVKQAAQPHPLADPQAPVGLQVLYDGTAAPLEFRDGMAFVREPAEGQSVVLRVTHRGPTGRLGCVLKVNGVNTLGRGRAPDSTERLWVLEPKDDYAIEGYQVSTEAVDRFKVLSAARSQEKELDYGADSGTITITVFRPGASHRPPPDLSDEREKTRLVERLPRLENRPANFAALTAQLVASANRGLITEGRRATSQIAIVEFDRDPTPVMSAMLVYYRP